MNKKRVGLILGLLILLATSISASNLSSNDHSKASAVEAVSAFASLLDENHQSEAFKSGSDLLQVVSQAEEWTKTNRKIFKLFGKIERRELKNTREVKTFPFLPDNDFLLVYHDLKMENKQRAVEVALLRVEDGRWKVCSYSIR